ncbi:MotA/TolQ/ExbB proton channel family protein [Shewanella sp. BF02_Schw]|uniref:MotA/TolQ/ExbB proton channel family protein n=1 Tax=unclassified Shewanella TaxID=196818 RepID=UPI001783DA1A|nr:MotA/TolQ/ExbB proton channel family protein [Shewanella sp. BF02_Schw]MBO1895540.1 MotA/TolQ/ExbB proton channel family protein [Shewanella sp. BF02_Schw]
MEILENLLRSLDTQSVSSAILVLMVIVCALGLFFTKQAKQVEFVNYVPTLLTTMGIFGTFLGIVLGLLDFNQLDIEASIPPLLEGLKTAFITSLAGILLSLVFKTLSTFSFLKPKQVEESLSHATPEAILGAMQAQVTETRTLKDALVGNEESTLFGQLKILRGDINDNAKLSVKNLQEQSTKQQEKFDAFSEKLWLKLQDFADTLSKSATEQVIEALKQVITDFNNNLTEQFGDNFKQLNEAVIKLVEWQENYKLQLEQMQQQYAQGVESISATESSVAHISEQSKIIPESMNELKGVMEVNQHQLAELERHLEAFKLMRDEAVKAVPEIRAQVQSTVEDISAAVTTASDHYKTLLSESDDYIKAHVKTSNDLLDKFASETEKGINSVGERLIESSDKIGKEIDTAATEFTNNTSRTNESLQTSSDYLQSQTEIIKQHLQDAVSDLNSTMRDMIEKLVVDAKDMNSTMKEANKNLVTDTENVRDTVVKSAEKLQQRLNEVIDDAATQQINQAKRTFDAMEEQIKQQVGLTGEAVDSQLKLIDTAMQQEINRVMNEMGQALAQVSGKFVEDYIKLTQAMNEVVNQRVA